MDFLMGKAVAIVRVFGMGDVHQLGVQALDVTVFECHLLGYGSVGMWRSYRQPS
jgi:hypothetical protein